MRRFFNWCKRYLSGLSVIVILFVGYTLFFQDNSLFRHVQYSNTIDSLRTEIKHYTDTMEYYQRMNALLTTDPEVMERVVREQYKMRRQGEDVYVFE